MATMYEIISFAGLMTTDEPQSHACVSFSTITLDTQSILRADNSNQPYVVVMTAVGTEVKVAKA